MPPKQRRSESSALQQLAALVSARPLYEALASLTREIYGQTSDPAMGALRTDLMMALLEANDPRRPVARWEACHVYICCVDAASREGRLNARTLQILINHATAAGLPPLTDAASADEHPSAPGGGGGAAQGPAPPSIFVELVAGDGAGGAGGALSELATLLAPPPVLHLLTDTLYARLEALTDAGALPGGDFQIRALVQLHALALRAPSLRLARGSAERLASLLQKMSASVTQTLRKALPIACELMVDDEIRAADPSANGSGATPAETRPSPVPEELPLMLRRGFARHVLLSYVIRKVELADEARAEQLLPMVRSMSKHAEACRSMSKHADACRTGWRLPACAHAPPPLARLIQVATVANELSSHPEFAGGLVSTLIADPARRLTPRLARACISSCLLPLSALLPHVLLRGSKTPKRALLTPSHAFARLLTPSLAFSRVAGAQAAAPSPHLAVAAATRHASGGRHRRGQLDPCCPRCRWRVIIKRAARIGGAGREQSGCEGRRGGRERRRRGRALVAAARCTRREREGGDRGG